MNRTLIPKQKKYFTANFLAKMSKIVLCKFCHSSILCIYVSMCVIIKCRCVEINNTGGQHYFAITVFFTFLSCPHVIDCSIVYECQLYIYQHKYFVFQSWDCWGEIDAESKYRNICPKVLRKVKPDLCFENLSWQLKIWKQNFGQGKRGHNFFM